MVLHNPNNWHWVNKDASEWARTYLEDKLIGIEAAEGGVSAKIKAVQTMEGDVDVSQRKGKVITLFDIKLQLEYEGECAVSNGRRNTKAWKAKQMTMRILLETSRSRKSLMIPRKMSTSYVPFHPCPSRDPSRAETSFEYSSILTSMPTPIRSSL